MSLGIIASTRLILSLSKDEASTGRAAASSFDAACGVAQDEAAQDEAEGEVSDSGNLYAT